MYIYVYIMLNLIAQPTMADYHLIGLLAVVGPLDVAGGRILCLFIVSLCQQFI